MIKHDREATVMQKDSKSQIFQEGVIALFHSNDGIVFYCSNYCVNLYPCCVVKVHSDSDIAVHFFFQ